MNVIIRYLYKLALKCMVRVCTDYNLDLLMTPLSVSTHSQIPDSDTGHNNNKNDVTTHLGRGDHTERRPDAWWSFLKRLGPADIWTGCRLMCCFTLFGFWGGVDGAFRDHLFGG